MEIGACDRSLRKRTSPPCVDRLIGAGCCDGGDFCEFPPLAAAIRHDRIVLGDVPVAVTAGFARQPTSAKVSELTVTYARTKPCMQSSGGWNICVLPAVVVVRPTTRTVFDFGLFFPWGE